MLNLSTFPKTSNLNLSTLGRPKRLTLEAFEKLPVSVQELELREKIYAFEASMYTLDNVFTDVDCLFQPTHRFSEGVYHRELVIPAGMVVVGKRHAVEHIVMLVKGKCYVATERGVQELEGPLTFISPAGEKRIVVSITETTWVTIHPTHETDLEKIEADVIIAEPLRKQQHELIRSETKALEK